jgi:hypothetical protein
MPPLWIKRSLAVLGSEASFFGQRFGRQLVRAGRHGKMVEESGNLMRRLVTTIAFSRQRSVSRLPAASSASRPPAFEAVVAGNRLAVDDHDRVRRLASISTIIGKRPVKSLPGRL